jgi:hypothetical protein
MIHPGALELQPQPSAWSSVDWLLLGALAKFVFVYFAYVARPSIPHSAKLLGAQNEIRYFLSPNLALSFTPSSMARKSSKTRRLRGNSPPSAGGTQCLFFFFFLVVSWAEKNLRRRKFERQGRWRSSGLLGKRVGRGVKFLVLRKSCRIKGNTLRPAVPGIWSSPLTLIVMRKPFFGHLQ